jgi:hypothetical protein
MLNDADVSLLGQAVVVQIEKLTLGLVNREGKNESQRGRKICEKSS